MLEFTMYYHNRPESCFSDINDAAKYLWPHNVARRLQAIEELESFHETANGPLMCKRTDPDAYKD